MIKNNITTLKNSLKSKATTVFNDTKNAMQTAKKKILQPKEDLLYIKNKNTEIKEMISLTNEKIEEQRAALNAKLALLAPIKTNIRDTTIEEFSSLMQQIENLPYEQNKVSKIKLHSVSFMLWKGKFKLTNKKVEVDKYFEETLEYVRSVEDEIVKYKHLSKFIDHLIKILEKFQLAVTQLNKQTINIINNIGTNYTKYSKEQQNIITKHTHYVDEFLKVLNPAIINEDESFNNELIVVIQKANEFLDSSKPNVFKEFKKRSTTYIYVYTAIVVVFIVLLVFVFK